MTPKKKTVVYAAIRRANTQLSRMISALQSLKAILEATGCNSEEVKNCITEFNRSFSVLHEHIHDDMSRVQA